MFKGGIIESSQSPYTSPVVAIQKKNGSVQLCLDVQDINKSIINDRSTPGEIDKISKKFHGTNFISTWDAVCRYWQVELHTENRQYLAFIFVGRNCQETTIRTGEFCSRIYQAYGSALGTWSITVYYHVCGQFINYLRWLRWTLSKGPASIEEIK